VGFLVTGVSPRRPLDGAYRAFLELLAGQIAVAVGSASAHEAELQRAETLRESEAFSRGVLESSPDCVKVLDASGRLLNINANGARLMEIDDFTSFVGRDWCDLWPEESRADVLAALAAARADGTGRFQGFRATAKGTAKWWDVIVAPIRNSQGGLVRFVSVSRDITERVQGEQSLRQRTAHFEALLNDAPLGAFLIDADFCVRAVNPIARQGFGDLPGLIGQHFAQAVPVEWPVELAEELVRRIGHTLQSGEPYTAHEYRVNRRDRGAVEHYDWQIHRIALPEGGCGVVCYYNDVSAQVRAREIIAESEDRYRTLFASAPMAVFACDSVAVIQDYNARAAEIWGREPVRGIEKHCGSRRLLLPDGTLLPHAQSPIVEVLRTGEPALNVEALVERPDGSRLPILANFAALNNARGEITGAITSFMDITEIKRLENDSRRHAADLLESDRRKNEFLAMLAHELRNPLAPIRNALHIMRMTAGDERTVQTAAAMMERQVGQMVRLVDDLLDVSRVSRGRMELRKERIELASAVNHAVEASRPLCETMNHRLELELPPRPIWVDADPTRLAQVVGNLLNNACKFTERGGCIRLSVEQDGKQAVIRVRDNGVGIAADELVRVFDLFVQVDTSLGRSVSGLGIGLTLVKSLVEVHGGSVHVLSAGIGQGSEFVVNLPMLAETLAAQLTEPVAGTPTIASARSILVVDDNRDAALSLATVLQLSGYTTHVAYDGAEAVQVAAAVRPDVMLLDIGLPKLDGYEVARKIRAQPWGEAMVLVALTGWGQEEDRRRSSEAGFNGHLVKPVDLDALMKLLAETLAVVLPD
ncbi:PAS domain-containing protein, partial [Methylibium sp.]|uniref:hybrid sensor histidine kinase/response regulator n=1 Tax=Methylibium sp. TaxID=2067992 RepID=UPI00286C7EC3